MLLKHRRLLLLSAISLLSVFTAEALPHAVKGIIFWSFCLAALLCFFLFLAKRRGFVFFLAALLAAGAFLSSYQVSHREAIALRLEEEETSLFSVTVTALTGIKNDSYTAEGRVILTENEKRTSLRVKLISPSAVRSGDVLFGEASFLAAEKGSYSSTRGFYGTIYFKDCRTVDHLSGPTYQLGELRAGLAARLRASVPEESGELLTALLLGDRDGLPDSFTSDMTRIGTTHMLSLSGMHLVVLTAGIAFLLRRLRLGKRLCTLLLILFAVFFMLLTGLTSSVMRASFMFLLSSLPLFLREEKDGLSSLSAAVAIICLLEPYAVRDLSLWLSALATLGILLFYERIKRERESAPTFLRRILYLIYTSLAITASATLATLPLTLCVFGNLTLLSPIANLVLSPLVQAALYLSVLVAILGVFSPLTQIASAICNLIFTISRLLADIPRTVISLGNSPALPIAFLLCGALLFYFFFCPKRKFRLRVPVLMCLVCALAVSTVECAIHLRHRNELTVSYYADVGNECDALLFRYKGERLMTVFSKRDTVSGAESQAFSLVADEVDAFLLPFYTENTPSYAEKLLSSYKIASLYLPAPQTAFEYALYEETLSIAAEHSVPTVAVKTDSPFFFGFLTVSELLADTDENASAQAEFLFGYSRIGYFGEGSLNLDDSTVAKNADILIFGAYGTSSEICFFREDFFGDSVRILCASPTLFPFTDLERIVFSSIATAYLPMRTAIP